MVNDVSGGLHDKTMLPTVGELGVPMILMHMRGTPETMQEMTAYDSVVSNVANALSSLSILAADECSIHRWQQMVDPGIGFAKDLRGNLLLLQNIAQIRSTVENLPLVIGTSRKSFIGSISGETDPHRRDAGTIASSVAALCLEGGTRSSDRYRQRLSILRVHNVVDCKQAVMVMDAIRNIS